ncbi:hypothetical protein GL50803_0017584 [Giardia duodenalis]|uniref:RRM domain-containing protein n=2 Tax=Giardia intestinalis TaxID=5741 RepID=A0A644F543_GIAIC|nr:hypothetical protein GL50803_0017584 [Giardia intestinalis]ESU36427.1 RNA-binding protein [Giardia intestinalis]KAE8303737.1 hypothetical protein GL50803_0017584 [Giardia intestinalis]
MSLTLLRQRQAEKNKGQGEDAVKGEGTSIPDESTVQLVEPDDPDYAYFKTLPDNGFVLLHTLLQLADIQSAEIDLDTLVSELPEEKGDDSLYIQTETDKVSVFVTNIARTVTEVMLRNEFGAICSVQAVHMGRNGFRGLRTAVIKCSTIEDVNRVIATKHGTLFHGEQLTVIPKRTYVGPQRERQGGPSGGRAQRGKGRGRFVKFLKK